MSIIEHAVFGNDEFPEAQRITQQAEEEAIGEIAIGLVEGLAKVLAS